MGISFGLYPPIFDGTYLPAQVWKGNNANFKIKIPFQISKYNNLSDIQAVHATFRNARTNQSMTTSYEVLQLSSPLYDAKNDYYYVTITGNNLSKEVVAEEYYKIQLRFSEKSFDNNNFKQNVNLLSNLSSFSQWSQVVLIKFINPIKIYVTGLKKGTNVSPLQYYNQVITGGFTFEKQVSSKEFLKSYRIQLSNKNTSEILEDSGQISNNITNASRQFRYRIKYSLEANVDYNIKVTVITSNDYQQSQNFSWIISPTEVPSFEVNQFFAQADSQGGRVMVRLEIPESSFLGVGNPNFIIKRASAETEFKEWETVLHGTFVDRSQAANLTWYDYTVQPGKWYKYAFQKEFRTNTYYEPVIFEGAIMIYPQDMFLVAHNKQLKIRFDPQITNFNYTVSESKQETIGSKYPFIRRNANIRYRTFGISGLITAFMDIRQNTMKASDYDIYSPIEREKYNQFKQQNNINNFNDYIQERDFRQKVMDFLYNNDVKLFKSITEGAILVKLMNITLTPNNELSRLIYSFSCTAVEIDQYNAQNCLKYAIQEDNIKVGKQPGIQYYIGQIGFPNLIRYSSEAEHTEDRYEAQKNALTTGFGNNPNKTQNYYETMKAKLKCQLSSNERIKSGSIKLCYLKIELDSSPYLITPAEGRDAILGHLLEINGQRIIINKFGIYELIDEGLEISDIRFPIYDSSTFPKVKNVKNNPFDTGIMTCILRYETEFNPGREEKSYVSDVVIGQYYGVYSNEQVSVIDAIKKQYYQEFYNTQEDIINKNIAKDRQVERVMGLRITSEPGTRVYVREKQDDAAEIHYLGQTGMLEFYDENSDIVSLGFDGEEIIATEASNPNPDHTRRLLNFPSTSIVPFERWQLPGIMKERLSDIVVRYYIKQLWKIYQNLAQIAAITTDADVKEALKQFGKGKVYKQKPTLGTVKYGEKYIYFNPILIEGQNEQFPRFELWTKIKQNNIAVLQKITSYDIQDIPELMLDYRCLEIVKSKEEPQIIYTCHRQTTDHRKFININLVDLQINTLYKIKNYDASDDNTAILQYCYINNNQFTLETLPKQYRIEPSENTIYTIFSNYYHQKNNNNETLIIPSTAKTYQLIYYHGKFRDFHISQEQNNGNTINCSVEAYNFNGIIDYYLKIAEREYVT